MDPFEQLLQALETMRAKCNETLAGLPVLDQLEQGSELAYAFRNMKGSLTYCESCYADFKGKVEAIKNAQAAALSAKDEEVGAMAEQKAEEIISTRCQSKELYKADEFNAAVQTAASTAEQNLRTRLQLLETRRAELRAKDSGVSADVVAMLTEEALLGEDYKATALCAEKRVAELRGLGVKVESVLCEAARLPVGEEGDRQHGDRVTLFKGVVESVSGNRSPGSLNSLTDSAASDGAPLYL